MHRNHCQELEVTVTTVDEAVAMAHGAIVRLARQQFLFAVFGEHGSLTFKEIHYLTVGVVAVVTNRCPRLESAKHDFVVLVDKST